MILSWLLSKIIEDFTVDVSSVRAVNEIIHLYLIKYTVSYIYKPKTNAIAFTYRLLVVGIQLSIT
jgi:hypothetical protein